MKRPYAVFAGILGLGALALIATLALRGGIPLAFPSGSIGIAERNLMVHTFVLMLIVAIPVYLLVIAIIIRYRSGNRTAAYTPDWEHSRMEELVWWAIPFEIVLVLAALTWTATHELDPFRPLQNDAPPITVQVVALPWKWLFIYPEQGVASVNELAIPVGRPVEFQITADAPMNSFWIPALGGQMYAMSGMTTTLHLDAEKPGTYEGRSANYSGEGFGEMHFAVRALHQADFNEWIARARNSPQSLSDATYAALAKPSTSTPVQYYETMSLDFGNIVHQSMGMSNEHAGMHDMTAMPGM
jgi:cytochrome o ubiquinol oxidase subunit 2